MTNTSDVVRRIEALLVDGGHDDKAMALLGQLRVTLNHADMCALLEDMLERGIPLERACGGPVDGPSHMEASLARGGQDAHGVELAMWHMHSTGGDDSLKEFAERLRRRQLPLLVGLLVNYLRDLPLPWVEPFVVHLQQHPLKDVRTTANAFLNTVHSPRPVDDGV